VELGSSVNDLPMTHVIAITNIRQIARISTLIENQPVTPAIIYVAKIFSLRS